MTDCLKGKTALVIDDHPVTHLGCRGLLAELDFEDFRKAVDGASALREIDKAVPDLILLDIGLPGIGGLKLLPQLCERAPGTAILVFTMNENPAFAVMALEQGAQGFLSKNARPEEFLRAVRSVLAGQVFLEQHLALSVATRTAKHENRFEQLTSREIQVLRLIAQGMQYEQIANEIHVSYKTVANVSSMLRRKLSARSLSDLIRIGIEMNLSEGTPE